MSKIGESVTYILNRVQSAPWICRFHILGFNQKSSQILGKNFQKFQKAKLEIAGMQETIYIAFIFYLQLFR